MRTYPITATSTRSTTLIVPQENSQQKRTFTILILFQLPRYWYDSL